MRPLEIGEDGLTINPDDVILLPDIRSVDDQIYFLTPTIECSSYTIRPQEGQLIEGQEGDFVVTGNKTACVSVHIPTLSWNIVLLAGPSEVDNPILPVPGSEGDVLTVQSGEWVSAPGSTDITIPVPIASGGTGLSTLGTGLQQIRVNAGATALEYFTPAASGVSSVSAGTGISVTGTASDPIVNLSTPVSVTNGGTGSSTTGSTFLPSAASLSGSGTYIVPSTSTIAALSTYTAATMPAHIAGDNRHYVFQNWAGVTTNQQAIVFSASGSDVFHFGTNTSQATVTLGAGQTVEFWAIDNGSTTTWLTYKHESQANSSVSSSTYTIPFGVRSIRYNGTGNSTWTLPDMGVSAPNVVEDMCYLAIVNSSSTGSMTVNRGGTNTIRTPSGSVTSFTIEPLGAALLFTGGTAWRLVGQNFGQQSANTAFGNFTGSQAAPTFADSATVRSSLGLAVSGANSDITSLSALSTPITGAQGGTGTNYGMGLVGGFSSASDTSGTVALTASSAGTRIFNNGSSALTYTLPAANTCPGKIFFFTRISTGGSMSGDVNWQPDAADKIEGGTLGATQGMSATTTNAFRAALISDGSISWHWLIPPTQSTLSGQPGKAWALQTGGIFDYEYLAATKGGTGQSSVTTGDLLYGSASNTWGKLTAVASGQVLASQGVGVAPAYTNSPSLTSLTLSTPLTVGSGGTGATTLTSGGVLTGAGTSAINSGGTVLSGVWNAGNVTSSGTVTASSGDITATNGHFVSSTVGKTLSLKTGANGSRGTGTLVAGTVVISNTSITANSIVLVQPTSSGVNSGVLAVTAKTVGIDFTVTSSNVLDTATFDYVIIEGN